MNRSDLRRHLYPTVAEERRMAELREKYGLELERYFGWEPASRGESVEDFKRDRGLDRRAEIDREIDAIRRRQGTIEAWQLFLRYFALGVLTVAAIVLAADRFQHASLTEAEWIIDIGGRALRWLTP